MRKLYTTGAFLSALLLATRGFCQTLNIPQLPSPPQPATFQRYDNSAANVQMPNVNGQVQMGATADDILRQANRSNPYYQAGGDPASNQRANEAWIKAQMGNDPAYNPSLRNGVNQKAPLNKQQELLRDLQDIVDMDNHRYAENGRQQTDFNSPDFAAKTKSYNDALQTLGDMLSGKRKLSLSEAYFTMENAYGETYLSHTEFKSIIQQSADFIKQWMLQNSLSIKDNASINNAVQQFMGNPLSVGLPLQKNERKAQLQTVNHQPFYYDYTDYTGEKDHRNYFLTKCLATGSGQCNSMPAIYLVLVEALGGTAYLSIAPQHSFIKYPDGNGNIRNYEPTSNWDISDQWYQEHMFISPVAVNKGIYLGAFSKKQIVADIVLQLSFGYFRKYGGADGKFINSCINTASTAFPKNNNISLYFTKANLLSYQLAQVMRKDNITTMSNINRYPEAEKIYEQWQANERLIAQLGYQDIPKNMYQEMMQQSEFRGKIQVQRKINGKIKHSLFTTSN